MTSFFAVFVSTGCIATEDTIPRAVSVMNNIRRVFRTLSNHRRYPASDRQLLQWVRSLCQIVQSSILRQFWKINCILWFACLHYVSVRFVLCLARDLMVSKLFYEIILHCLATRTRSVFQTIFLRSFNPGPLWKVSKRMTNESKCLFRGHCGVILYVTQ